MTPGQAARRWADSLLAAESSVMGGDEPTRVVEWYAVGDPQAPFDTFARILERHGLLDPNGRLRPEVGLVSIGDHFDFGSSPDVTEVGRDGERILRFLAAHPRGQAVILLGNHDTVRVQELAAVSDEAFARARSMAQQIAATTDEDTKEAMTEVFSEQFPAIPLPSLASRDFSAFSTSQRRLVQELLLADRVRLAVPGTTVEGAPVLLNHAGVTMRELALLAEADAARATGADASRATGADASRATGADASRATGADASRATGADASRATGADASRATGADASRATGADAARATGADTARTPERGDSDRTAGSADVDPTRVAHALNAFLREAVQRVASAWRRGEPAALDLGPLHLAGRTGVEGGGLLYHRPGNEESVRRTRAGEPPRRYSPRALPLGLAQVCGHSSHKKLRVELGEWVQPDALAVERGGQRTLTWDGTRVLYRMGIQPIRRSDATVFLIDAEMNWMSPEEYPLLRLRTVEQCALS